LIKPVASSFASVSVRVGFERPAISATAATDWGLRAADRRDEPPVLRRP